MATLEYPFHNHHQQQAQQHFTGFYQQPFTAVDSCDNTGGYLFTEFLSLPQQLFQSCDEPVSAVTTTAVVPLVFQPSVSSAFTATPKWSATSATPVADCAIVSQQELERPTAEATMLRGSNAAAKQKMANNKQRSKPVNNKDTAKHSSQERQRNDELNNKFKALQNCLLIPQNSKISKIKLLRIASLHIQALSAMLDAETPEAADRIFSNLHEHTSNEMYRKNAYTHRIGEAPSNLKRPQSSGSSGSSIKSRSAKKPKPLSVASSVAPRSLAGKTTITAAACPYTNCTPIRNSFTPAGTVVVKVEPFSCDENNLFYTSL